MAAAAGSLLERVCREQCWGDRVPHTVRFFEELPPTVASIVLGEIVGCFMNGNTGSVTTSGLTFRFQQMFKPSK